MNRKHQRPFEERLAAAVIRTVEGLGDDDWEWIKPNGPAKPDFRILSGDGCTIGVEITNHVDDDDLDFRSAVEDLKGNIVAPELSHAWTLGVERGTRRLKESLGDIRRVLAEIEKTGGCSRDMLAEAQRRFDPRPFLNHLSVYLAWDRLDETCRPSLHDCLRDRIDYWWPAEIVEAWLSGEWPDQTIHPLKCQPASMGGVRIEGSFFGGWDLVGEELKAAVQSRIDAKHKKRQLAGHDRKWLAIVLGDTDAYWQFIHPPEDTPGHWATRSPSIFADLDYRGIDQVWIMALTVRRTGKVLYLRLPPTQLRPETVHIPPLEA